MRRKTNRKRERESKREREREKRERERGERERENLPETCGGPESASSSGKMGEGSGWKNCLSDKQAN